MYITSKQPKKKNYLPYYQKATYSSIEKASVVVAMFLIKYYYPGLK